MTALVQKVGNYAVNNATSLTLTFGSAVTAGNTIVIVGAGDPNSSAAALITSITDNKSNTSPGYSLVKRQGFTGIGNMAEIWSQEAVATGGTSFTLTINLAAVGVFGGFTAYEITNNVRDQNGITGDTGTGATSATATCGGVNGSTTDFAVAAIVINGGANPSSVSNPPSGWTAAGADLNGATGQINQHCYRDDASAVTDSATWSWTTDGSQGWAAVIASWKPGSAPTYTAHLFSVLGAGG